MDDETIKKSEAQTKPNPVDENTDHRTDSLYRRSLLWVVAVLLMFIAVIYQRKTGPTYPKRGTLYLQGQSYRYRLIRSEWTSADARAAVPVPTGMTGQVLYKRFKTKDKFMALMMERDEEKGELFAMLPKQPAAGKLEYYVQLSTKTGEIRIPSSPEENIIIRFKDPVPDFILWPHVVMMFFSVLVGMRAGLGAIFAPLTMRRWVWIALGGMTLGGMTLGPIVQKYAFGEYWTGFPFGGDLTDNKMLVMWLAWLLAAGVIGFKRKKKEAVSRSIVVVAAVIMVTVYLIPHSMRGSELDYSKVDSGVNPTDAIKTGK
ncbi:MAG: hypothetical protein O3B01_15480 [Planctomycetota bacterium]|nr:hypothetical protein [Planctomycetota bacterium]MDA1139976.1 hypothetical protein [Planctomycetota bacterium]